MTRLNFTAQQADALNIITQSVPKSELDTVLKKMVTTIKNRGIPDFMITGRLETVDTVSTLNELRERAN